MVYLIGVGLIYVSKYCCERYLKEQTAEFKRRTIIIISFTILFLISALRGSNVGIDTSNYMQLFTKINRFTLGDILTSFYTLRVEMGFALVNKILGVFTDNPYVIIVFCSAVTCAGMAFFIIAYTKEDITPIILFLCGGLFVTSLNTMRQMIAVILLFNSWGALNKKQYKLTAVLFLISFLFHWTSILYVAVYLVYFIKDKRKIAIAFMAISALVIINYRFVIELLANFAPAFRKSYLSNEGITTTANGIWAVWLVELIICSVFFAFYFTRKKKLFVAKLPENLQSKTELICVPLFVIYYIALTFIGTKFNYFYRFGTYFMPFNILLFVNFEKLVKEYSTRLHKLYIVGLHVCFIAYLYLSTRSGQFYYPVF